jgi:hypothetical protein
VDEVSSPASAVGEAWYAGAVRGVEVEAERLHAAVETVVGMLRDAAKEHGSGVALRDVVGRLVDEGGREVRRSPASAFASFEAAVTSYRAQVVTAFVEQHGMTYTEIGRLIGVSRQMVARLHHATA